MRKLTVQEVNRITKEELERDKNSFGNTVLYCATYGCPIEVVEAILDKGVNIDGLTDGKWTALMGAAYYKKWDIIKLLVRRGADAKILDAVCL
jgi:ankyrin repeat protein